jgi:hypothetical protein
MLFANGRGNLQGFSGKQYQKTVFERKKEDFWGEWEAKWLIIFVNTS